jgi:hypothetical protein
MDLNEKQYAQKTESEIRKYNILKSVFTKIYESENDLNKKRKAAFDEISSIEEPENQTLKDMYKHFCDEMKALEDNKFEQNANIKSKFIPAIDYYSYMAKHQKQQVGQFQETKKKTQKQEEEIQRVRASQNTIKESQLQSDIRNNKSMMENKGLEIKDQLMMFEDQRTSNNKLIILHFIHNEMAYHAKAIEKLSDLYKTIRGLDARQHLKEFADKLNITTVDLEEYGYNDKSFSRSANRSYLKSSKGGMLQSTNTSAMGKSKIRMSQMSDDLEKITEENQGGDSGEIGNDI